MNVGSMHSTLDVVAKIRSNLQLTPISVDKHILQMPHDTCIDFELK